MRNNYQLLNDIFRTLPENHLDPFLVNICSIFSECFTPIACCVYNYLSPNDSLLLKATNLTLDTKHAPVISASQTTTLMAIHDKSNPFIDTFSETHAPELKPLLSQGDLDKIQSVIIIPISVDHNPNRAEYTINIYLPYELPPDEITKHHIPLYAKTISAIVCEYRSRLANTLWEACQYAALTSQGLHGLFDQIKSIIEPYFDFSSIQILELDDLERISIVYPIANPNLPSHIDTRQLSDICFRQKKPYMPIAQRQGHSTCSAVCVPIINSCGAVNHCIVAHIADGDGAQSYNFCSLGLFILSHISRIISSPVDRLSDSKETSFIVETMHNLASATVTDYELTDLLDKTINSLVHQFNAEIGSIYLVDDDANTLKMSAASGKNKDIQPHAVYEMGEGVTGAIAENGQLLNFRSTKEMYNFPNWKGKYDKDIWGDKEKPAFNFLGVPIRLQSRILGVLKITNMRPSQRHPDPYFTHYDETAAITLATFLGFVIERSKVIQRVLGKFRCMATSLADSERFCSLNDICWNVTESISQAGFAHNAVVLFGDSTHVIEDFYCSSDLMQAVVDVLQDNVSDISTTLYEANDFVVYPAEGALLDGVQEIKSSRISAIVMFPLICESERVGVLLIGRVEKEYDEDELILKAFTAHLALAISRFKNFSRSIYLTDNVLSSARFMVAFALSSEVVHSLHQTLKFVLLELEDQLQRKEVKERKSIFDKLSKWKDRFEEFKRDTDTILDIVRRVEIKQELEETVDIHERVHEIINFWIVMIKNNGCKVDTKKLSADNSTCIISFYHLKEILSILIVNSIQAYAKNIRIATYNESAVRVDEELTLEKAFILEVADDGHGILAESDDIFKSTFSTKPDRYGTGLGLFIARGLARKCPGQLLLKEKKGEMGGAVFQLILPVALDDPEEHKKV